MNLEEVKIELTNFCKRNCIHCSSDANTRNIVELDFNIVKKIVDECSTLGVKSIVLTGGEATEYRDVAQVVEYIHDKKIPNIKLYTMCEPTLDKYRLLEKLTKLGLTEIIYSLTISLTTDQVITFDHIQEFLEHISKINQLSFHYCLTTATVEDLKNVNKILSTVNFKNFSFLRYVEHGRGKDDLVLSSSQLKKIKPMIVSFIQKYGSKIHLGSPFNILNIYYTPCTAGEDTMIIGFDGRAYPCDAMKYFNYMGSGGNIYTSSILDIYYSDYFEKIRQASHNLSDDCIGCAKDKCRGGCLAQKMLTIMKTEDSFITTRWYQENALRTMNHFENRNILVMNAYTGIYGEYGEFFDYMKKLYTHNLSEEKKLLIMDLAPKELGDLIWYLSTSFALVYQYTLEDVYDYLFKKKRNKYELDDNLVRKASNLRDPLCSIWEKEVVYCIDDINLIIDDQQFFKSIDADIVFQELRRFKMKLNKIDYIQNKKDAIEVVAEILLEITIILRTLFHKNLSEVLYDNINKLRERYPEGFDKNVADLGIDANKKYKEEVWEIVPKERILKR